ncbi:hypothetical protein VNO77_16969 [Canavalia gladiata]|uniref:Uncharacterized protein n=1 Tax=Canavalia gladiata TaxID=3824 RepID=A0AAN9LN13_CANGL
MDETEELLDKIEGDQRNISHILEIKELLINYENEVTNIGTTVRDLQLHWSRRVIREAQRVVDIFKKIIEEQIDETAYLLQRTKGHGSPTTLDEHVLFNPPTEGFPIGNIPKLDFTRYFEDIDDDGNPIIHSHEKQINPSTEYNKEMKLQLSGEESDFISTIQKEKQELIEKLISQKNYAPSHKNWKIEMTCAGQRYPPITQNKRKLELQYGEDSESTPIKKRKKNASTESSVKWNNRRYCRPSDTECSLQRFRKHKKQIEAENERKTSKDKDKDKDKDIDKVHQRSNAGSRQLEGAQGIFQNNGIFLKTVISAEAFTEGWVDVSRTLLRES